MKQNSIIAAPSAAISPLHKGLGLFASPTPADQLAHLGWNLLREEITLPAAVLYSDKLEHNLRWMQRFIDAYGLRLAPHGKTTMAPALFRMQIEAGAWGITVATAQQARVVHAHGICRVLMANQLIGKANIVAIAELLRDPSFDFYCLVDSAEQVQHLAAHFRAAGLRLQVLIELGVAEGRTGVRNDAQLNAVLAALAQSSGALSLCGVELYEGVLKDEPAIRSFLRRAVEVTRSLLREQRFARTPALLSGAGSAWYDVVAEEFSAAGFGSEVEIVLRPGCYLTHDVGAYRDAQARILEHNPIAHSMLAGLEPALHVWAYVQSIPEPGRAIVGFGKRDAAFDSGLPVPALHYRPGTAAPTAVPAHWTTTKMMDQHAYLSIAPGDDLRPGDMLAFDIAHPCLTFDKWRVLSILDAHFNVTGIVETFF